MQFNRRDLLKDALVAATVAQMVSPDKTAEGAVQLADPDSASSPTDFRAHGMVDVNVHLFHWPFRRLPLDSPARLATKLKQLGFRSAWAGSFEAVLHRDIAGVNERLAAACRAFGDGMLIPFGTVHLGLPDWEEDLRRCRQVHQMPGVRLYPGYHGYGLDDPEFERFISLANEDRMLIQLVVSLEDPRTQHPMLRVDDVVLEPLIDLLPRYPLTRIMLLNHRRPSRETFRRLVDRREVMWDTARVESTDGLAKLIAEVSPERVAFGTHSPFLIPEAGLIRVYESDLDEETLEKLLARNADQFLEVT